MAMKIEAHIAQELGSLAEGIAWNAETGEWWSGLYLDDERKAQIQAVFDAHDPDKPPRRTDRRFSKRVLFGALTDAEYAIWEQVESQQTPRRQRMLREAVELNEADEDYPDLYMAMVAAFGQERADEVLAKAELA